MAKSTYEHQPRPMHKPRTIHREIKSFDLGFRARGLEVSQMLKPIPDSRRYAIVALLRFMQGFVHQMYRFIETS